MIDDKDADTVFFTCHQLDLGTIVDGGYRRVLYVYVVEDPTNRH